MTYALLTELADHSPLFATPFALFAQLFARAVHETDRKTTTGKQRRAVHQLSGGKVSEYAYLSRATVAYGSEQRHGCSFRGAKRELLCQIPEAKAAPVRAALCFQRAVFSARGLARAACLSPLETRAGVRLICCFGR
jgi:hypothetical protein